MEAAFRRCCWNSRTAWPLPPSSPPHRGTRALAPHGMQALAAHFIRRIPSGYGLIINPGTDAQIFLPPDGVAALQQDIKAG